jgi:hypothetical protein
MKKALFIFVLICATAAKSFAQMPRHEIGIEAGPSYTNMFGTDFLKLESGRVGFLTGLTYQYNFPKFFSIRTGFAIEQKGAYNTLDYTDTSGNVYGSGSYVRNINYFSLPVLMRFSFGKKAKFFVNAGGYMGFIFDSNVRLVDPNGIVTVQGFDLNRFEVGATLGIGGMFTILKRLNLSLEVRDNLGLYNLGKGGNLGSGDAMTNSLYGLVGVSYNIGLRK